MHDVIIIGAGPAGLATAYHLRELDLDVLVLEAGDEVGGRTRSVEVAGEPVNTGAMFIYRDTPAHELASELGIRTTPFEPTTYGVHFGGSTVVSSDVDDLADRVPRPPTSQDALRSFMRATLDEYSDHTAAGAMSASADELSSVTVSERLSWLPYDVRTIVESAIQGGAVGRASQLSAKYALRYFASCLAHEKNNRLYPVDGMQALPAALARSLPENTIRLGTSATRVQPRGDGTWDVHVKTGEHLSRLQGRHVVAAVPSSLAGALGDWPGWKTAALSRVQTPGSRTLCVVADISGAPELRDWAFGTTVGTSFDAIINPRPGRPGDVAQFVCYGNSAGHLSGFSEDRERAGRWLDDFLAVAPQLRGRILGWHAQTWPHCFSLLTPARADVLDELQRPVGTAPLRGRLHVGHRTYPRCLLGGPSRRAGDPRGIQ